MKKIIFLSVIVVIFGCSPKFIAEKNFNFNSSEDLAKQQTDIMNKYVKDEYISESDINSLKNNLWVVAANHLAPGNLVVRQYYLIDLIEHRLLHESEVRKLVRCLSYGGKQWAEGYSYWLYTREILDSWVSYFKINDIARMTTDIDSGFAKTAYLRDGIFWYPVPLGDVYNAPLSTELQKMCWSMTHNDVKVANIELKNLEYIITSKPVGMNFHVPKENYSVKIVNGRPEGFIFYKGYKEKYKSKDDEIRDLTDKRRLETMGCCD